MVNRPDILFADEPCANLDSEDSRMVLDFFMENNESMHQTIVMVSPVDWHKEYFHRIIRLRDGKITSDGITGTNYPDVQMHQPVPFLVTLQTPYR